MGDHVLKVVATLPASSVRERDVAARLAADEFVLLFSDADLAVAEEIVTRIHDVMSSFDWNAIAPNLRVSLTIGLSEAFADDTAESIMHRSDKAMYSYKALPRWEPTNV